MERLKVIKQKKKSKKRPRYDFDDLVTVLDGIGLNLFKADAPPGSTEMIAIQLVELNKKADDIATALERCAEALENAQVGG